MNAGWGITVYGNWPPTALPARRVGLTFREMPDESLTQMEIIGLVSRALLLLPMLYQEGSDLSPRGNMG